MTLYRTLLALVAALALAVPVAAQEQEQTDNAADLPLGEPVSGEGEPQPGQTYIREEIGEWSLRCIRAPEGEEDPCQLYKLLLDDEGNSVAEISIFRLPEGGQAIAGATVVTPLETLLTAQLTMAVDARPARRYPFTFCTQSGCIARVGLTAEDVEAMRNGNEAFITLVPAAAPDQPVTLRASLSGFTAGFEEVSTLRN